MPDTNASTEVQEQVADGDRVSGTPLPWTKLSVLLVICIAEPACYYLTFPFMYEMFSGFDIVHDPKDTAFYVGALLTTLQTIRVAALMCWSNLSNRIGRRPMVFIGLLGDFLTFALFGLSKSFGWAMFARCLNGLFSLRNAELYSIVFGIPDKTNRARMRTFLILVWQLGSMLGGAIGGLLANPVTNYPWLFGDSVLFHEYPYLLPCLFGSAISLVSLVVGFFYMDETLVVKPTTAPGSGSASGTRGNGGNDTASGTRSQGGRAQTNAGTDGLSRWDVLTPTMIRVVVANTILCFATEMSNHFYPVFAASDIAVGGLGMDTQTIGISIVLCSGFALYTNLVKYLEEEYKYGVLDCCRRGLLWMAVFGFTLPLLSNPALYLGNTTASNTIARIAEFVSPNRCMYWSLLLIEFYIRMYGNALAFTSGNAIMANVAPSKNHLWYITQRQYLLNGITYLFSPLLLGYLWSWSIKHSYPYPFNSHFVWVLSGVLLVVAWFMTQSIPDSVEEHASDSDQQNRGTSGDESSNPGQEVAS